MKGTRKGRRQERQCSRVARSPFALWNPPELLPPPLPMRPEVTEPPVAAVRSASDLQAPWLGTAEAAAEISPRGPGEPPVLYWPPQAPPLPTSLDIAPPPAATTLVQGQVTPGQPVALRPQSTLLLLADGGRCREEGCRAQWERCIRGVGHGWRQDQRAEAVTRVEEQVRVTGGQV